MSQEFDARHYLETLYAGQPEGTLAAIGTLTRPHFLTRATEALPYVVGQRDIYARMTLLRGRPNGRGAAADSVALPGVWAEIDVNGGPKSGGGVVTDGAADREAAVDLAHSVIPPTMLVASGYGVHGYWLLERPWVFDGEADRDKCAQLLASWQRRLRHEARARGIEQLDSTHDLARVLRVPGTYNGKGEEPQPVVLLDNGGPRYELEAIAEHGLAPAPGEDMPPGEGRTPAVLLAQYPKLKRIAHREGEPPGDGTGHTWDWFLMCEACRRVKPPLGREEAIALLAHARRLHADPGGKGERADYLERTVERAFAATTPAATAAELGAWIGEVWELDGPPIVRGWATGVGETAHVSLQRSDGSVIGFPRLRELFDPAAHVRRVSVIARTACPALTKKQALAVTQSIIELCDVTPDDSHDDELMWQGWIDYFVGHLGVIVAGELLEPGPERWKALAAVVDFRADAREVAARTCGVRDSRGRLWLPADALMRHVRYHEGEQLGWDELHSRMVCCGWERRQIEQWQPGVGRDGRRIRRVFYVEGET